MSEVKRYHVTETGLVEGESLGRLSVVLAADFDRVTAGRDAALAELGRYQSLFNQAQKAIDRLNELHRKRMAEIGRSLTAADEREDRLESGVKWEAERNALLLASLTEAEDMLSVTSLEAGQRIDVLEGLLREVVALDPRGEFMGWQLDAKIDAALKPAQEKPE